MTETETHLSQLKSIRDWLDRLIEEMENELSMEELEVRHEVD